jgi:ATP-dependent Lon protease
VLLPARNEPDLDELPEDVLAEVRIRYVHRVDELLPLLLAPPEEGDASPGAESPSPEARV